MHALFTGTLAQEDDHKKLLEMGCAAVFEPISLYHPGECRPFMLLQQTAGLSMLSDHACSQTSRLDGMTMPV